MRTRSWCSWGSVLIALAGLTACGDDWGDFWDTHGHPKHDGGATVDSGGAGDAGRDAATGVCGNGLREASEACDDGNKRSGDGCSERCELEGIVKIDSGIVENRCPNITAYSVSPLQLAVGSTAVLTASVTDADGDPTSLFWSATAGNIATAGTPGHGEYDCTTVGEQILTLTAADAPGCEQSVEVAVTCVPRVAVCGDGWADVSEACEDGNRLDGDGCSASCQLEAPPSLPNRCPAIVSTVVGPLVSSIGGSITLAAEASDPDGDSLSFSWSAQTGVFADATSARTTYRCTTAGASVLTLRVSDGRGCTKSFERSVTCQP